MSWSTYGDGESMTVKELIEELQKFDGDMKVGTGSGDYISHIAGFTKTDTKIGPILEIGVGDCVYDTDEDEEYSEAS